MQCDSSHTYQTFWKNWSLKKWKLRQNLRFESAKVKEFNAMRMFTHLSNINIILKHWFLKKWELRQNLRFESAKVKEFNLLASPGFWQGYHTATTLANYRPMLNQLSHQNAVHQLLLVGSTFFSMLWKHKWQINSRILHILLSSCNELIWNTAQECLPWRPVIFSPFLVTHWLMC